MPQQKKNLQDNKCLKSFHGKCKANKDKKNIFSILYDNVVMNVIYIKEKKKFHGLHNNAKQKTPKSSSAGR